MAEFNTLEVIKKSESGAALLLKNERGTEDWFPLDYIEMFDTDGNDLAREDLRKGMTINVSAPDFLEDKFKLARVGDVIVKRKNDKDTAYFIEQHGKSVWVPKYSIVEEIDMGSTMTLVMKISMAEEKDLTFETVG